MNKPKAVVVIAIVLLVAIVTVVLLYFRGVGVSTDKFSVITSRGEGASLISKEVIVDGDNSLIRVTEADSVSERGLKTYEIEDIQTEVARLNLRWSEPNQKTVCGDLPEPDSFLSVKSGSRTGTIYFCEGVGADEAGNIVGPYQDLLVLINELDS